MQQEGRTRVIIERVTPEVDGGRFPAKRSLGEMVSVEADIFCDGQDVLSARLLYRPSKEGEWADIPMTHFDNDRWRGEFRPTMLESYTFTIEAWVDRFLTWQRDLKKKVDAKLDVSVELLMGAEHVSQAAARAGSADARRLNAWAETLKTGGDTAAVRRMALGAPLRAAMSRCQERRFATALGRELQVTIDPERASFSAWYEMFPRSTSPDPKRPGTFKDCEARLPYLREMGFDVLYLPPIHPIGSTSRKGPNNTLTVKPSDPGSPWAIGAAEGGHKSVHPELGTLEDFRHLVQEAKQQGIDVALDIAFQCSPDHPYVHEHPQWFRHRPDGAIQYAENPPKKYEDIFPFDFESEDWRGLWEELKSVFLFWIEQGVHIFRVDNPHTKSLRFWEWAIGEINAQHADTIFLAEAFTRPKVMHYLAKLGYTHSYTYFTWKNTKVELTEYFTELAQQSLGDFFRPNVWTNTPDILHEYLQRGGKPAFVSRVVLASTLAPNWGMYGPPYELMEHTPREHGSEEYLNSEKYQVRHWNLSAPASLKGLIAQLNRIRKEHPALRNLRSLHFHEIDNDQLLCYSKTDENRSDVVLVVVNLDYKNTQSGWVNLTLERLGLAENVTYQAHDLLTGERFTWSGARNYVKLDPKILPAHVLHLAPLPPSTGVVATP